LRVAGAAVCALLGALGIAVMMLYGYDNSCYEYLTTLDVLEHGVRICALLGDCMFGVMDF